MGFPSQEALQINAGILSSPGASGPACFPLRTGDAVNNLQTTQPLEGNMRLKSTGIVWVYFLSVREFERVNFGADFKMK